MMTLKNRSIVWALGLLLITTAAEAARYEIVPGDKSRIVFESKAPLEKFEGKTRELSGHFDADLENLSGEVSLVVEVDLASFDTGMKKRNKHMRENHLETEKYPRAWFRAGGILRSDRKVLAAGQETNLVLRGTLDLHGVKKDHDVTLLVKHGSDGNISITGGFPVLLSDHAIERPKFLVMKLADRQEVKIELLARPAP